MKWITERLEWSALRTFGNSALVKASIAVPVVGYLILLSAQVTSLLQMDSRLQVFRGGFPWRLSLTYYGLVLLAAGSILYGLRCPALIKRYAVPLDYVDREKDYLFSRSMFKRKYADIERLLQDWGEGPIPGTHHTLKSVSSLRTEDEHSAKDSLNVSLTVEWHLANCSRPRTMLCTAGLFGAGSVLLAGTSAVTFLEVTVSTFRALFRLAAI